MLDFLKSSIGIVIALAIGFGAAELMNGGTSFLTKMGDTLLSWRASHGYAILGRKNLWMPHQRRHPYSRRDHVS